MLREQQLVVPGVTLYNIVPALAKAVFDIRNCGSFDDCMYIVPGVWVDTLLGAA